MHLSTIFAHWSAHLRRRSKDASLTFDQDGALSLLVDKHKIDCRIAPDSLILRARICGMPERNVERHAWLCRILMLSNAHAHHRREFPVLTAQRTLQLQVWIHARADYEEFCSIFDRFMEALDAWRHALLPRTGAAALSRPGNDGKPFNNTLSDISKGTL